MCLILFAIDKHPLYPFVVIANRDEFYARPTRSAHWWDDNPSIYAGRDLQANGTWMGVDQSGRFAAVTNVREPGMKLDAAGSRGDLPGGFLKGNKPAEEYMQQLQTEKENYAGYNLLLADKSGCWFSSNRYEGIKQITAGIYGVSNGYFDEPWPKLKTGKLALQKNLQSTVDVESLFSILLDRDQSAENLLPETGVSMEFERLLSSRFIHSNEYGTRASSVVLYSKDNNISFTERNFDQTGAVGEPIFANIIYRSGQ